MKVNVLCAEMIHNGGKLYIYFATENVPAARAANQELRFFNRNSRISTRRTLPLPRRVGDVLTGDCFPTTAFTEPELRQEVGHSMDLVEGFVRTLLRGREQDNHDHTLGMLTHPYHSSGCWNRTHKKLIWVPVMHPRGICTPDEWKGKVFELGEKWAGLVGQSVKDILDE